MDSVEVGDPLDGVIVSCMFVEVTVDTVCTMMLLQEELVN